MFEQQRLGYLLWKFPHPRDAFFSKWVKQERGPIKQIVTRAELRELEAVPQAALMLEAAPGYSFDFGPPRIGLMLWPGARSGRCGEALAWKRARA